MRLALVPFAVAWSLPGLAQTDVIAYDLAVTLRGADLAVTAAIEASGARPAKWRLELAPEMKVEAAESAGKPVPFAVERRALVLDLAGLPAEPAGKFTVAIRCAGAPSERFAKDRGGFVRSAVTADLVWVRSQVAWYPRAADDPARHRLVVDAPAGWQVRAAGEFAPPVASGDRATWTFATAGPIDRAGLAAGPWQVVSRDTFDALVTAPNVANAAAVLDLARQTLEFHAGELGPLARPRFALVELPVSFGSGSGYSEAGYILLGPGAFAAGAGADWVRRFLAHETAHQWWGHDGLFTDFASEMLAEYAAFRCEAASAGAAAAGRLRRAAAERLGKAIAAGKQVGLATIRGYGGNLDAETYQVHAYEKGLLLLAAVEDAVGAERMRGLLREFLATARERRVGWADLRAALCAAGPAAQRVVETWERPGLPGGVPAEPPDVAAARAALERGMKVANSPKESDPKVLVQALADLRAARSADLADGEQAAAQTGIGRCLFRLGKLDEAAQELAAALKAGAGGPFHRGWAHLRLGNIADLRGQRQDALTHYRAVIDNRGASAAAVEKAKACLDRPYRGFAQDG